VSDKTGVVEHEGTVAVDMVRIDAVTYVRFANKGLNVPVLTILKAVYGRKKSMKS
jgi:hypothetical protein